ncbi:MAG TPA: phospholipase D-like domain-containing protein [Burkholderiaceae bacterium]|nr:phospholipase D-like domain-containing protein [Burkholderiaceae bacterium]
MRIDPQADTVRATAPTRARPHPFTSMRPWMARVLTGLALAVGLAGCASLPPPAERPETLAIPAPTTPATPLDHIVAASRPTDSTLSGFRLLHIGSTALAARLELLRRAQRSLDVQYYHVHNDDTGRLVLRELRDAARRGVRVRLLLDDMYTQGMDRLLVGLASEPRVEVRLFNPFATRGSAASRFGAGLFDFARINNRMHNKLLMADGVLAVIGGRNVGDEYYFRSPVINFFDLDAVTAGAVVPQLASLFDAYWNSPHVRPVQAVARLPGAPDSADSAEALRREFDTHVAGDRAPEPPPPPPVDRMGYAPLAADFTRGRLDLGWGAAQAWADPPEKAIGRPEQRELPSGARLGNIRVALVDEISRAREEVFFTTPYFVPGDRSLAQMRQNIARGVQLSALTNSLGSTDEQVVHTGYRRYRDNMLRAGVQIYELDPVLSKGLLLPGMPDVPFRLHTKSAVLDRKVAFLGSLNLDPRSQEHNTELGVIAHEPRLAADMHRMITLYKNVAAYQVRLQPGTERDLEWVHTDAQGKTTVLTREPGADWWTRVRLYIQSILIPETLL